MRLSGNTSLQEVREEAEQVLSCLDDVKEILSLECAGAFVLSPPRSSRIVVKSLSQLHEVRALLREKYGWRDFIRNKFFSCGDVIACYAPTSEVELPIYFEIWMEAPPEDFPAEVLGDCRLVPTTRTEYSVVCEVPA